MDRAEWIKEQRRKLEEQEDKIYSPIYDENWGEIDQLHRQFMENFLQLCPCEISRSAI